MTTYPASMENADGTVRIAGQLDFTSTSNQPALNAPPITSGTLPNTGAWVSGTAKVKSGIRKVSDPIKQRNFWYLYRVRAVNSIGNFSAPSNIDLATAITFSDDPLAAGSTPVRAQHLTELRQAVNAVRATANLSAASWTDSSPLGAVIKAIHIQELRTSLDEALNVLGLTAGQYTDSSLSGIAIKKVHIDEIRQRVK